MRRRKRSPSPHRRMRRSSGLLTCCSERSKYGTPVAQMASIERVGQVARVEVQQAHPVDARGHGLDERRRWPRRRARRAGPCRTTRGPGRRARSRGRRAASTSVEDRRRRRGCAAGRGTTGWRRTRTCGRSPRRSSRTPTGASTGGRGRLSRSSVGTGVALTGISCRVGAAHAVDRHAEAGDLVDLGQGGGQLVAVALGHAAVTTRRAPGRRCSSRARIVSIDSWRAASMKAQVLTTTRSAAAGSSVGCIPSASSVPTSLSESTWFFGQPSLDVEPRCR